MTKRKLRIPNSRTCFILSLLILIIAAPVLCDENEPVLEASLDRASAPLGSIITLTLRYRLPEKATLDEDPNIDGLEDLTQISLEMEPGAIRVKLMVDRLGSWKTGPIGLTYTDKEGNRKTLSADPVSLDVVSNLGEKPQEAQLKPIQDIIPAKYRWLKYWPWAVGALLALIIGLGFFWWYKRRSSRRRSPFAHEPAHIRAKKELEALESSGLFETGRFKAFYFRFSEILRHYLESLRAFPAAEFTTEEIASRITSDQDRKLLPLLRHADLVKFADTIPTPARKEDQMKLALDYIDETSPKEETTKGSQSRQGAQP